MGVYGTGPQVAVQHQTQRLQSLVAPTLGRFEVDETLGRQRRQ